jgi:predicted RNA-binding Zn ribbon-like protein
MEETTTQPGGRAAAPGELGIVQAFVNTENVEAGTDELPDPAGLRRFLSRHGLLSARTKVTRDDLGRARELRTALRALAAANNGEPLAASVIDALDRGARSWAVIASFAPTGEPREIPTASGVERAFGELLAIVHRAMRNGTWPRLKACREHNCRWLFYDHSRNRSGTWCAMSLCGTRSKMRTYRALRASAPPTRGRRARA